MNSYPEVELGEIETRISGFLVSAVPSTDPEWGTFSVRVELREKGRFAVCRNGRVVGPDDQWQYEMQPSSRTAKFLRETRFSLDEALQIAKRVAPLVSVNGITASEWASRRVDNG